MCSRQRTCRKKRSTWQTVWNTNFTWKGSSQFPEISQLLWHGICSALEYGQEIARKVQLLLLLLLHHLLLLLLPHLRLLSLSPLIFSVSFLCQLVCTVEPMDPIPIASSGGCIYIWHPIWHTFWHPICISGIYFWHSVWHIFWHSVWHSVWHSLWHVFGSRRAKLK